MEEDAGRDPDGTEALSKLVHDQIAELMAAMRDDADSAAEQMHDHLVKSYLSEGQFGPAAVAMNRRGEIIQLLGQVIRQSRQLPSLPSEQATPLIWASMMFVNWYLRHIWENTVQTEMTELHLHAMATGFMLGYQVGRQR